MIAALEAASALPIVQIMSVWMAVLSLICFFSMGVDKSRAKHEKRRIPERRLFSLAFFGGAAGGLCGMYLFRHKTRHSSFRIGMPLLLLLNAAVYFGVCWLLS